MLSESIQRETMYNDEDGEMAMTFLDARGNPSPHGKTKETTEYNDEQQPPPFFQTHGKY